MKAITIKSRRALLIFLSALTLTLVFYASLPARPFLHRNNYKIETQISERRTERKLTQHPQLATSQHVFTNAQVSIAYEPWTAAASPRAPPV